MEGFTGGRCFAATGVEVLLAAFIWKEQLIIHETRL